MIDLRELCNYGFPMNVAEALEFPWVKDLPRKEKSVLRRIWDQVEEISTVQRDVGPIYSQVLVAQVLGVSRQRIGQLIENQALEGVDVGGRKYVSERSLRAYCGTERKTGRPVKGLTIRECWKAASEVQKQTRPKK